MAQSALPAITIQNAGTVFAKAMAAYEDGHDGEARRLARRLADAQPQFGGAHYLLGLLALRQGQGKRAAESLARAIAITPGQPPLHLAMAQALESTGDRAEAMLHYRMVIQAIPSHAEAHARLGILLADMGERDDAITHCRAAIAADPIHAEALNTLGALLSEAGQHAEARDMLARALAQRPDWPAALNNYGVVLRDLGALPQAEVILSGSLELRPNHAPTMINLASVLRGQGRLDDARALAEKATRLQSRNADGWLELGLIRQAQDHPEGAAAAFDRATIANPELARAWFCLGQSYRALGEPHRVVHALTRYLELDPADQHGAGLLLALAGGAPVPAQAPAAYVRQLFDDYANHFDHALVDKLEYRAPQLLARALEQVMGLPHSLAVMDAGCGTGLMAPLLRPLAARLDGVDLSGAMVAKARERGLYDTLDEADLVSTLADRPGQYDLIAAADVLVYLGDLEPVIAAARRALKAGGHFAFTVERADTATSYVLGPKQRYAHAPAYIRTIAAAQGFTTALMDNVVPRRDGGQDVPGLAVVLTAV